jgi:hypothetical protein
VSLRYEQYTALRRTRQFLADLLHPSTRPKTVKELRGRASACLRHYPFLEESGKPMFSQDEFKSPEGHEL